MSDGTKRIVDQDWYLRRYPDVAHHVGLGHHASASDHYETYGAAEGRFAVPRPPRFIIHIGPHKTGTTYLQTRLLGAQDFLEYNKCLYPSAWRTSSGVSHELLPQLLEAGSVHEMERDIQDMVSRHDTVIISSEDLSLLNLRSIDLLGRLLSDYDAMVVFAVRPWPDRMLSLWRQTLFNGGTENLPEFAARHLADPRMSYLINDVAAIEGWCHVFGRSKVALISYADLMVERVDIFDYFVEKFMGTNIPDKLPDFIRVHESPDHISSEIARSLNALSKAKSAPRDQGYHFLSFGDQEAYDEIKDALSLHTSYIHLDDSASFWDQMRYEMLSRFGDLIVGPCTRLQLKTAKDLHYISADHFSDAACREGVERLWHNISAKLLGQPAPQCSPSLPFRESGSTKSLGSWRSWWRNVSGH